MYHKWIAIMACLTLFACSGDPTGPTPVPTTTTSVPVAPQLISHDAKISRSVSTYHYISWRFDIDSPRAYGYAYVEAKWFDADGFQIKWTNWSGALQAGLHTYTDETMVAKDVWARVVRREVALLSWR